MDAARTDNELTLLLQRIWEELVRATRRREHPWRVATLATVNAEGRPDARSVVLRDAVPPSRELLIYADSRSPKIAQIAACNEAMLVCWSSALSWQLRMTLDVEVQTSGLDVSSRWARMKLSPAAQDYLSPLPPGTPIATPVVAPVRESRDNFALMVARVREIDWLELNENGHRRARLRASGAHDWLTP
jgi:pyridoxamine 5'-phosphate oxidase